MPHGQDLLSSAAASSRTGNGAEPRPSLVVRDVWKRWSSWKQPVLHGVDLELRAGTSTWIAGRNGAGKTTLLRIIAGLISPDRGLVRLYGLDPECDGRRYRTRIGLLSAGNAGLFARLPIWRHLDYQARISFVARTQRHEAVERALELFALSDMRKRRVDRLSMGQRQRVRAAMAFISEPDLLLLDEPHTSLDDEGVAIIREALRDSCARGATVLWLSAYGDRPALDYTRAFTMTDGRLEPGP